MDLTNEDLRCANLPTTPTEAREIPTRLDELDRSIGALHETLGLLEARLAPICSPAPCDPNVDKDIAGGQTTIGSALIRMRAHVEGARNRVSALTSLVEV